MTLRRWSDPRINTFNHNLCLVYVQYSCYWPYSTSSSYASLPELDWLSDTVAVYIVVVVILGLGLILYYYVVAQSLFTDKKTTDSSVQIECFLLLPVCSACVYISLSLSVCMIYCGWPVLERSYSSVAYNCSSACLPAPPVFRRAIAVSCPSKLKRIKASG